MVVANPTADIPALKARHPLGGVVEAAGVQLRGRGRVRQGLCPFHEEDEGSFTVYADSERWFCFGCGLGGDVLDFIQRVEGLTLPEAMQRLDGSPAIRPKAAVRSAGVVTPRHSTSTLPPRDPALLTAAARFYAGELRRSHPARAYLKSRAGSSAGWWAGPLPPTSRRGFRHCPAPSRSLDSVGSATFHSPIGVGDRHGQSRPKESSTGLR